MKRWTLLGLALGLACSSSSSECDRACLAVEDLCFEQALDGACGDLERCELLSAACFEECM